MNRNLIKGYLFLSLCIGCLPLISPAQSPMRGRVTDGQGVTLPGVSVTGPDGRISTVTDSLGYFSVKGAKAGDTLVFSHVGYTSLTLMVSAEQTDAVAVTLKAAGNVMQEVEVSTGYYTVPRERATGSFEMVDNALLNRSLGGNLLDRLEGVTGGLLFDRRGLSGEDVNGTPELRIRGISTIEADSRPLIVVDNFPYEGDISNLDPNMVEHVTVLKDAAAASIWGARAGNGVIVITTKQAGYNQKNRIGVSSNVNISAKPDLFYNPNNLPAPTVMEIQQELFERGAYTENDQTYLPAYVELLISQREGSIDREGFLREQALMRSADLRKQAMQYLYRNGFSQQHALNILGGSGAYRYTVSAGYDGQSASIRGNGNDRLNINAMNAFNVGRSLEINGGIRLTVQNHLNNGLTFRSVGLGPMGSVYERLADPDGSAAPFASAYRSSFRRQQGDATGVDWQYRPLEEMHLVDRTRRSREMQLSAGAAYTFPAGFRLHAAYQHTLANGTATNHYDRESYYVRNLVNRYTQADGSRVIPYGGIVEYGGPNESTRHYGRLQADFNREMAAGHRLASLLGAEIRQDVDIVLPGQTLYDFDKEVWRSNSQLDYRTNYPVKPNGRAQIPYTTFSPSRVMNRYLSYFGNASHSLFERYTVSGSLRWDGSNLLGVKTNQRGTALWSLGASWELSAENFFPFRRTVPYLRFRMTYGSAGNIDKSQSYHATISSGSNPITGLPESSILHPGNPSLRWEQVNTLNVGADWRSRNQRLAGNIEFYHKKARHLLGENMMDPTTGVNIGSIYRMNYGHLRTTGWDIRVDSRNLVGTFGWTSNLLASTSSNEVTHFNGPAGSLTDYLNRRPVVAGESVDLIYAFPWYGLSPDSGMPLMQVDGQLTDAADRYADHYANFPIADLVMAGTRVPTFFGSLRNTFSFRGLELSALLSFKAGHVFRRSSIASGQEYATVNQVLHMDYFRRWERPGDERLTDVPAWAPSVNPAQRNELYLYSMALITRGDVIRLQDASCSYTLDGERLGKLPFRQVKVNAYARNLGILWRANSNGLDPDFPSADYPAARIFAAGFTVTF